MIKLILINFVFLFTALIANAQNEKFSKYTGPYLGQKPPGLTPEIFAPGIISRPGYFEHSAAIFTPDGKEVYWSAKPNDQRYYKIYFMKMVDGIWSTPEIAAFCKANEYYQQFTLSPDGKKLYYTNGEKLLYVEKKNNGWSLPLDVPSVINAYKDANICCVTNNGSIYFISRPGYDVFVTGLLNGNYTRPERLGKQINSDDTRENSVYAAPDESYMIIEATKDAATCELFVSFRMKDNSWSERKKLPINWGRLPHVSPDGKYLFFMTREGIYWVSAKIIDDLRPKGLK
jgi:Tol biopolymer transport system component